MAVEFKKDKNGRWVSVGQIQDKTAYASDKPAPAAKPKPKPGKSWWQQTLNNLTYEARRIQSNPGGAVATYARNVVTRPVQQPVQQLQQLRNHVRHETGQLANPATRTQRLATYGANAATELFAGSNPVARQVVTDLVPAAATSLTNLGRNLGGAVPALDQAEELAYRAAGQKPPAEMSQGEKAVSDAKASLFANAALAGIGGAALAQFAPRVAASLNPVTAPNLLQGLARGMVTEGLADAVGTLFEDNTGGSALGLVDAIAGTKSDPVKPGMSYPEATAAAVGPNALFALGLAGAGAVLGRALPGHTQAIRGQRLVDEKTRQRKALEDAGLQQSNPETGQSAFTPEAVQAPTQTPSPAPAAAPVQPEAPAAARTGAPTVEEVRAAYAPIEAWIRQPDEAAAAAAPTVEAAPGAATAAEPQAAVVNDQWEIEHDPSLPEADVGLDVIERLDDDELPIALQSDDPVSTAAEIIESRPEPALDGVAPALVQAPADALAPPTAPWRSQWQALPTTELQGMAFRSPELGLAVERLTGRTWDEASKLDLLDGLDSLAADGRVFLPSRMNPKGTVVATGDIAVAPEVFQFKGNVDAAGRQKGNSLEGVDKWNTDLEGVIDTWENPVDGLTYVVNGHNRVAMAKQAGIPSLETNQILAGSAQEARAIGALRNIAQGSGTAFDAAKFFRDSGIADQASLQQLGVPMSSGTARSGLALAQLPQNIFQDAVDGKLSLGKAQALGEAGLDEAAMQSAYKALQGQDMTDGTWAEVLQQAGSAPVIQGTQVDLFGNTEAMSLMVQKGDLARLIRAEVSGDKKLFGSVKRNADKLAQGGNQISKTGSGDIAAKAGALLDTFDREKYAAGTPISELLNQGAAEVAGGAKPAVVAKRIKQQLVASLDQLEVTAPASAVDEAAAVAEPQVAAELTAEDRAAMQMAAMQKAIANGKVRPSATPIPELPSISADLTRGLEDLRNDIPSAEAIKLLDEEARLQVHYRDLEARAEAAQVAEMRDATGYHEMTYEQKKALGITEGYQRQLDEGTVLHHGTSEQNAESIRRDGFSGETRRGHAGAGTYFTTDAEFASEYGSSLFSGELPKGAKVLDLIAEGKSLSDLTKKIGLGEAEYGVVLGAKQMEGVREWALANGYDGIRYPEFANGGGAEEVVIYNSKVANKIGSAGPAETSLFRQPVALPAAKQPDYVLPPDLQGSAPAYGLAKLEFASDLDRAAYILRDPTRASAGEERLIKSLQEWGYDIDEIRQHGVAVNNAIKAEVKTATGSGKAPQKAMTVPLTDQNFVGAHLQKRLGNVVDDVSKIDAKINSLRNRLNKEGC